VLQLKKRVIITLISLFIILVIIQQKEEWTSVFRITEQPDVLIKGNNGMTLTVDLSFGREDVEEWITNLEKPYPLLFLDADWIERSPLIVKKIKDKKIPVGLLGSNSKEYEGSPELLAQEISKFQASFDSVPLWYRTQDNSFPDLLKNQVWEKQMNMVSSSVKWSTGSSPSVKKGDIVSVSLHRETRIDLQKLTTFQKQYSFVSLEETLFGYKTETKTFP